MCFMSGGTSDNGAAAAAQAQVELARQNAELEQARWKRADELSATEKAEAEAAAAAEKAKEEAALAAEEKAKADEEAAAEAARLAQEAAKSQTGGTLASTSTLATNLSKTGMDYDSLMKKYANTYGYGQGQVGYAGQQNNLITGATQGFNNVAVGGRRYS